MTSIKQPTPVTVVMVTQHLHPPRTAPIAHNNTQLAEQTASHGIPISFKCDKVGHWGPKCCGGKPLQPRNAPPPRNAPLTWSQHGKSRHLPRSHNCHPGKGGKTNAIDVGEDHSPQDEIALHGIKANVTPVATGHTTGKTTGVPTHDELFIDAINYGTIGNTHPEEIMVGVVCTPWCNEAYTTVQLPASASRKGTASLHIKVNTRAGGSVLPLYVFQHLYPNQISQLAFPLAWITSAPGSPPITDPIYPYMVHSVAPLLGSQATLALDPTG